MVRPYTTSALFFIFLTPSPHLSHPVKHKMTTLGKDQGCHLAFKKAKSAKFGLFETVCQK